MTVAVPPPALSPSNRTEPSRREPTDVPRDQFDRILARHADEPHRRPQEDTPEPQARRTSGPERTEDEPAEPGPDRTAQEHRRGTAETEQGPTDRLGAAPGPTAATGHGAGAAPVATSAPSTAATSVDVEPRAGATATGLPSTGPGATPTVSPGDAADPAGAADVAVELRSPVPATAGVDTAVTATGTTEPAEAAAPTTPTAAPTAPTDAPVANPDRSTSAPGTAPDGAGTSPARHASTPAATATTASATPDGPDVDTTPLLSDEASPPPDADPVDSTAVPTLGLDRPDGAGDAAGSPGVARGSAREARSEPSMHQLPSAPEADDLLARAELRRLTGRGSRLDIGLSTSDLGRIEVAAIDRGQGLQLQLTSDQPDARRHLARHLDELRGDLAAAGVDVGSVDVGDSQRRGRQPGQPTGTDPLLATPVPPAPATVDDHRHVPDPVDPVGPAAGLDLRL